MEIHREITEVPQRIFIDSEVKLPPWTGICKTVIYLTKVNRHNMYFHPRDEEINKTGDLINMDANINKFHLFSLITVKYNQRVK